MIEKYPEIFSEEIKKGCKFHEFVESSRQKLKMKRLFFVLLLPQLMFWVDKLFKTYVLLALNS